MKIADVVIDRKRLATTIWRAGRIAKRSAPRVGIVPKTTTSS